MTTQNTYTKYKLYSVEDLLQDDYFILSITNPTNESEEFWNKILEEGIIDRNDYNIALYFIDSVKAKTEPILNDEIFSLWENIQIGYKSNLKNKKKRFRLYLIASTGIVAAITLFLSLVTLPEHSQKEEFATNIKNIKAPDLSNKDIHLILADNETVSLEGKKAEIAYNENGIAINNQETNLKKKQTAIDDQIVYNQLIVPMGKRSMLTFAEGSKIWINAGTRVVYPAVFNKNKREIFIDGEAFLDVSYDKNWPFIVKTKEHEIEVLGTSFNVTAYENDTIKNIVLVSGLVKINLPENKSTILSPNELYTYSNGTSEIRKINVDEYISWRSGVYQYKSEQLGIILQRLSRYYGKEIDCSEQLAHLKCTGKLDLNDDLQIVLNGITKNSPTPITYKQIKEKYIINSQ